MNDRRANLPGELDAFVGDFRGLLAQIGHSDEVEVLRDASAKQVTDAASLRHFLHTYVTQSLYPVELPAICKAYFHTARYECRELIALDKQLATEARLLRFGSASAEVGRNHLLNLRPLRENRFVQRYIVALEAGEVHAWHTLVYGVSLSVYSVPLRQGLLAYSSLVLDGFALAANGMPKLLVPELRAIVDEVSAKLPEQIDFLLAPGENLFKAA
ncbi:MAG: urease accessory UreF family protein [Limisphaerales bacterium]